MSAGSDEPKRRATSAHRTPGLPIQLLPPPTPLSDGEVAIRLRVETDFAAISEGQRDALTRQWLTDRPMENDTPSASVARAAGQWASGRSAPFVIADAVSDAPLGLINLRFDGADAFLAYSVFASSRGRGVAPRAVPLLTAWAFRALELPRLLIEADQRNEASRRVAEKCGFRWVRDRSEVDHRGEVTTMAVFELDRR